MKKYVIYAPAYDENNGGAIVLHKLCDILLSLGIDAYLHPMLPSFELHLSNIQNLTAYSYTIFSSMIESKNYRVNPNYKSQVIYPNFNNVFDNNWIALYPEITFGNPLNATNVTRWILHNPGFHSGKIYYGLNELHFLHSSLFSKHNLSHVHRSKEFLNIIDVPIDIYSKYFFNKSRSGFAYCIRKGKNRIDSNHVFNGPIIDNLSHMEISEVFSSTEYFISYDMETAYSEFAVLSGCQSIIVPDPNISLDQWLSLHNKRYGIAYGIDDLDRANQETGKLLPHLEALQANSITSAKNFISETSEYFN